MLEWLRRVIQEFLKVDVLADMQRHEGDALEDATFDLADKADNLKKRVDWLHSRTSRMDDDAEELTYRVEELENIVRNLKGEIDTIKNLGEYGPVGRIPNDL